MSEARKYHLNLIVANQFTTQLTPEIRDAVFGNMGTIVSFRIGQNDVESLSQYFQPTFDGDDLLRVPNYNTIVRTLIGGVPTQPFSMATLPGLGTPNPRLAQALKQLAAAKYGRPKAVVDAEINERMATKETAPTMPARGTRTSPQRSATAKPNPNASFLDEWLNKRRSGTPPPTISPAKTQLPAQPQAVPSASTNQFQPTATPTMPAPAAQNISSNEIEQAEVSKIAAELKQQLDTPAKPAEPTPEPESTLPKLRPKAKTEHTFDLKPGKDDTIFIDQDGSFHLAEEEKSKPSS